MDLAEIFGPSSESDRETSVKRKVCENNSSPETKDKKKPRENVDEETVDEDIVRRRYLATKVLSKSEYSDYLKKRKIHKLDKIKGKEDLPILPVPILLKSDESLEDYESEFCKWLQSKDIHLRDMDVDKERSLRTAYADLRFKNKLGSKKVNSNSRNPAQDRGRLREDFRVSPMYRSHGNSQANAQDSLRGYYGDENQASAQRYSARYRHYRQRVEADAEFRHLSDDVKSLQSRMESCEKNVSSDFELLNYCRDQIRSLTDQVAACMEKQKESELEISRLKNKLLFEVGNVPMQFAPHYYPLPYPHGQQVPVEEKKKKKSDL